MTGSTAGAAYIILRPHPAGIPKTPKDHTFRRMDTDCDGTPDTNCLETYFDDAGSLLREIRNEDCSGPDQVCANAYMLLSHTDHS